MNKLEEAAKIYITLEFRAKELALQNDSDVYIFSFQSGIMFMIEDKLCFEFSFPYCSRRIMTFTPATPMHYPGMRDKSDVPSCLSCP